MPELYAKLAVGLVVLVVGASPRVGSGGVTVALPVDWHSTRPDQGNSSQPLTRIVVSSGSIRPRLTGTCQSIGGMKIGAGPGRPRRFTATNLPVALPEIECFAGRGGSAQWAERGHSFAAYILLGRKAPTSLAARGRAVLDTLRVSSR